METGRFTYAVIFLFTWLSNFYLFIVNEKIVFKNDEVLLIYGDLYLLTRPLVIFSNKFSELHFYKKFIVLITKPFVICILFCVASILFQNFSKAHRSKYQDILKSLIDNYYYSIKYYYVTCSYINITLCYYYRIIIEYYYHKISLHDFSVSVSSYMDFYLNSFFALQDSDSLPSEYFPLTYDLSGF